MACVTKEQLKKLQATLKTDAAIGKKFGITRQAIHQFRMKYGLDYNRKKHKDRNDSILALSRKGLSGSAIAKKSKLSISQVYRIMAKA